MGINLNEFIDTRRRAILRVTPQLFVDLFKPSMTDWRYRIVSGALPEDAHVVGVAFPVRYDAPSDSIEIVIESESFAPIPFDCVLPYLDPAVIKRVTETEGR